VLDKYRLQPFATLRAADAGQADVAVAAAQAAFRRGVPAAYERGAVLEKASRLVQERTERFVRVMQREAGFTAQDARNEVRRCVETLRLSGEEARPSRRSTRRSTRPPTRSRPPSPRAMR
jgi:succinate-semialdehyde dehydrogenase/glutarate-semialdehyde dehydrogenase